MYVLAHAIIFRPPQTAGLSAILHQDHCCIAYVNAPITQLRIVRAYSAGDVIRITRKCTHVPCSSDLNAKITGHRLSEEV